MFDFFLNFSQMSPRSACPIKVKLTFQRQQQVYQLFDFSPLCFPSGIVRLTFQRQPQVYQLCGTLRGGQSSWFWSYMLKLAETCCSFMFETVMNVEWCCCLICYLYSLAVAHRHCGIHPLQQLWLKRQLYTSRWPYWNHLHQECQQSSFNFEHLINIEYWTFGIEHWTLNIEHWT